MKFSDFIQRDAIVMNLASTTRDGVIREMVDAMAQAGSFPADKADDVFAAIINREEIGTTGIGSGIAVPHAKVEGVSKMTAGVGLCADGIDFSSLDCEKVKLFIMLVSPKNMPREHLNALGYMTQFLRQPSFRQALLSADLKEEIVAELDKADIQSEAEEAAKTAEN